ncbi:hypothetical protein TNCV_3517401 [Trichonephila clavipes]|nr:hypothetical protein TNCV_3517401 [Trichonephila clavipes]
MPDLSSSHKEVIPCLNLTIHSQTLLHDKQLSPYCTCIRRITSTGFTPPAKRIIALLSPLVLIDNRTMMLNDLLNSNDYKVRQVARCVEVLLTIPQSALDTSAAAKSLKEKE